MDVSIALELLNRLRLCISICCKQRFQALTATALAEVYGLPGELGTGQDNGGGASDAEVRHLDTSRREDKLQIGSDSTVARAVFFVGTGLSPIRRDLLLGEISTQPS